MAEAKENNVFDELNAQDEVQSMMEDNEVMDQLEEIGRMQRSNREEKVQVSDPLEQQMNMPAVDAQKLAGQGAELADLLEDSMDGGIVQGAEQSFDFNPPEAVSSHAAATGFDAEFTETVVIDQQQKQVAQPAPQVQAQAEPVQSRAQQPLMASSRSILTGLGTGQRPALQGVQQQQQQVAGAPEQDTLFDNSMMPSMAPVQQHTGPQEAIEDMSMIVPDSTQFMNQTDMDLFGEGDASQAQRQQQQSAPRQTTQINTGGPAAATGAASQDPRRATLTQTEAETRASMTPAQRHEMKTKFDEERKQYATNLIKQANPNQAGQFVTIRGYLHSDELARHFDVVSYQKNEDHFVYVIDGIDPATQQVYQIKRRYKHFLSLRNSFVERLPGLYVPALPKKQSFGKNSVEFLKERCYLLSMFIKQVAKCPYLVESEEFQVFVFPQQDIDKQLSWLHEKNFNPSATLARFQRYFQIHGQITETEMNRSLNEIMKFTATAKRMQQFLTKFIDYISIMHRKYEENNARANSLNKFLYDYELHSVLTYSPKINTYLGSQQNLPEKSQLPEEQLLFQNTKNQGLKEDFDNLPDTLTNPFTNVKMWLKYEILEIDAILETIEKRHELEKRRSARHSKRIDDLKELNNLQSDKFTFGSVFMSKDQIQRRIVELKRGIESCEQQLYDYENLAKLATMSLVKNTIPFFKTCKFQTYYQSVNQFTATEIDNCEQTINLFQRVIGLNQTLIQRDVHHWEQHDRKESSRIISFNQAAGAQGKGQQ